MLADIYIRRFRDAQAEVKKAEHRYDLLRLAYWKGAVETHADMLASELERMIEEKKKEENRNEQKAVGDREIS